jgi:hypothetical protein
MTVLDGKNAAPFITDAMFTVDFNENFTESAYLSRKCVAPFQTLVSPSFTLLH